MGPPILDLPSLRALSLEELAAKARDERWLKQTLADLLEWAEWDRQTQQLAHYTLANPMALPVHTSRAREVAVVGGNRSSKTDTMLAELSIQATGHIPRALWDVYPREKLRAPIRARVVCNSLVDTLEPIIKPKLRYDQWNGVGAPNQRRGHWGWIPQHCLPGGSWEKAYSEKNRTLKVAVDNHWVGPGGEINRVTGYSTIQFMSYDQDLSAFVGSSMHFIGHDELPPAEIYKENRLRTLDVAGQIYTAFTPPDQLGAARGDVSWFFDEVYERGLPGPQRHKDIESIILHTERNRILDAGDIADMASKMSAEEREVRLLGRFIHLTGVIFHLFTSREEWWCFKCQRKVLPVRRTCPYCTGDDLGTFTHVLEPFPVPSHWPVVMVIDPHPRKKDAVGWFAISPIDDVYMVGELNVDGTAEDVVRSILQYEKQHKLTVAKRLMDPNIALETNDKLQRGWTLRAEYERAGLTCDLANDDMHSGINEVLEYLKPDLRTRSPRLQIFNTCQQTMHAMQRWSWDDWGHKASEKEPKEKPRDKFKDFCDVVRYCLMDGPSFAGYRMADAGLMRLRRG